MRAWVLAFGSLLWSAQAVADDPNTIISVISGHWVSVISTDEAGNRICVGATPPTLGFRASPQGLEIRITDDAWSMSADVHGDVTFKIGSETKTFPMSALSGTTLAGEVQATDLADLLDAMDKAPFAKILVGKAKPITVSLNGSTRALNDFRTCSTVKGYGDLGGQTVAGGNPFQN